MTFLQLFLTKTAIGHHLPKQAERQQVMNDRQSAESQKDRDLQRSISSSSKSSSDPNKKYTYEDKVNTYIVEYIEPLLKDLDKKSHNHIKI